MSQGRVNSNKPLQRKRVCQGVLGTYLASDAVSSVPVFPVSNEVLETEFSAYTSVKASYGLATNGSLCELPGGGAVVVSGRPRFADKHLAELAESADCASAIAQGYGEFAEKIFSRLLGSFCCGIVDTGLNRVLVGIDRLGQHSVYYSLAGDVLAFGNSAIHVLDQTRKEHQLNNQGIYNYLYFHMVPCPDTIYQGLKKLSAAHYIDYRDGQCQLVNYWQPRFSESASLSIDALSSELLNVLRSSVERCLRTGDKVGSFLSGGLDSSTVTGMLAEVSGRQAEAYSIGFSAEGYDEMAFARNSARHFGIKLNEYYVTPQDVLDALPLIAISYEEPFGNSSALPAYFCAKMAAENGIDTLLAGDGGDEIFAGNERYIKQRAFAHYSKIPPLLRRGLLEPFVNITPAKVPLVAKVKSYIDQANTPLPDRLQSYNFLHRHPVSDIFSDQFLAEIDPQFAIQLLRSIYQRPEHASELNRLLYLDWQITLADNDLRKVSHTCTLAGVDVAYPMLDDDLVDLSCRVPSALKIKGNNLRHFYKYALRDWLPQETLSKKKQGFGLPFGVWMQTYPPLREMAYDHLLKLKKRDLIRPGFIDQTITMHQSEHAAYYGELVWILTVFELWMEGRPGDSTAESIKQM